MNQLNLLLFEEIPLNQLEEFNAQVKNNYGPHRFIVEDIKGNKTEWGAVSKRHLELLLKVDVNMGYCHKVKNITRKPKSE